MNDISLSLWPPLFKQGKHYLKDRNATRFNEVRSTQINDLLPVIWQQFMIFVEWVDQVLFLRAFSLCKK